jgi:hypothetical protein
MPMPTSKSVALASTPAREAEEFMIIAHSWA